MGAVGGPDTWYQEEELVAVSTSPPEAINSLATPLGLGVSGAPGSSFNTVISSVETPTGKVTGVS